MERTGSCSCGNIGFTFTGEPINTVFCYCKECQIAFGSDRFFGIWLKPEQFKLNHGQPQEFRRKGDSGYDIIYRFCANCSTKVCGVSAQGMVIVAGASLENTDGLDPKMAIYTASAPSWALLPKNIPCFTAMPERKSSIKSR